MYHFFISLTESCFSTSAFRNVHFLLDLYGAGQKKMHFSFLPADYESFPLWYACTLHCFTPCCSFSLFKCHVHNNSYKSSLSNRCPFKIWWLIRKLYLYAPEGTCELPPIPEVKDSWRLKSIAGKCMHDLLWLSFSITAQIGPWNRNMWWHQPGPWAGADKSTLQEAF